LVDDLGDYKSPLVFDDGRRVQTPEEWQQRREEIARFWQEAIGTWPASIERPAVEVLQTPRPFLLSGGAEDRPSRWKALNHTVAVNRLLGFENRVAMTNREGHSPTEESNEQLYLFFEYFLKPAPATR
jgi:hypothetical protein